MDLRAAMKTKGDMSDMPSVQPTEHPRTSPPRSRGQNTCLDIPLAYVCRSTLSREQRRLVLHDVCSRSLKKYWSWIRDVKDQTGLGCELDTHTDEMTPWFSGVSTINGTPGEHRSARVLGGQGMLCWGIKIDFSLERGLKLTYFKWWIEINSIFVWGVQFH